MDTIVISTELQKEAMKKVRRPFARGTSVVPSKKNYKRRPRNRKDSAHEER